MCVKQQVKRKLYVEFRVTFTEKLYSSFGIKASVDQERPTMAKKKKKKRKKRDVEKKRKKMMILGVCFKKS
jgi:hypothetical protein